MAAQKIAFRNEALKYLRELDHEPTLEDVRIAHKLDCLECELHPPKSSNCRDNPYCINRIGLEKYAKTLTTEEQKAEKVQKDWIKRDIHQRPCGLRNEGNFCYMNSFLQVFFNDPVFRQAVYRWKPSPNFPRAAPPKMDIESVMTTLQKIFFCLEYTPFEDSSSHNFTELLRLKNLQQDAQEFTLQFLSALERLLPDHPNGKLLTDLIKTRYHGKIVNRTYCECGGRDNKEYQPFMNILVPIEGQNSLLKAFDSQYELERLHECLCHACGASDKVCRKSDIVELPQVLFFQLSRYKNDLNGRRKLKNPIAYPRTIKARQLQPSLSEKEDFEYELFAVMIHEGDNAHCGHYYDLIKHPFNGEWFKYNDEVVEKLTKPPGYEKVARVAPSKVPNDMKSCYALIYRKVGEVFYSCEPPQAEICQPWREEYENDFAEQTGVHLEKSSKKVKQIRRRYKELVHMFSSLKAHTDRFKNEKKLAFVPMDLLTDIVEKEREYAAKSLNEITDENVEPIPKATKLVNGTSSPSKRREQAPENVIAMLKTYRQKVCPHGLISIDSVLHGDVKVVSGSSFDKLLSHYNFSVKLLSGDMETDVKPLTGADLCLECPKKLLKEAHFMEDLQETLKLTKKIARETTRCTTHDKCKAGEGYFVVARKSLQNFGKLAEQQFRSVNWLCGNKEIAFIPGDKPLSQDPNGVTSRTSRARKRRLQNGTDAEDHTEDDEAELKQIVGALVDTVCQNVEGDEEESDERSPTPTVKPDEVCFNDLLMCEHGATNCYEFRLVVSSEEWEQLASHFRQSYKVEYTDTLCQQCSDDHVQVSEAKIMRDLQKKELRTHLGEIFTKLEKRLPQDQELGTKYTYGVCSNFVLAMKAAFKRATGNFFLPPFCNSCVICELHGRPCKTIISGPASSWRQDESQIVPITEDEWRTLSGNWPAERADEIIAIQLGKKGEIQDFCAPCFKEMMQLQHLKRLQFEKQFVFVKVVPADASDEPEPEKRVPRRANPKSIHKFKMSHTDSIRDLKLKLYEKTHQTPSDQMLFNGSVLLDSEMTLFEAMVEPNNQDQPLKLMVQTIHLSPSKFDDDREPEMGFAGTALTF